MCACGICASVCCVISSCALLLSQGEDGEAGNPGSVGELGAAVSHVNSIFPSGLAQHRPLFALSLIVLSNAAVPGW